MGEDEKPRVGAYDTPPPAYDNPIFEQDKPISVSVISSKVMFNPVDKSYDPYDHCTSKRPTSYWDSVLHLLKAAIGTGILAMPSAFRDAGYAVGIIGCIIIGIYYTYCIHLIVTAEYELCRRRKKPNLTYGETVETAFEEGPKNFRFLAPYGRFLSNFFFMLYECGGCAIYVIFIASNIKNILDFYYGGDASVRMIMSYMILPIILICWVRNLKLLAPLSAVANVIIIVCFFLIFWYVFQDVPSIDQRVAVGEIKNLPLYLTTVLFAVASTGLIFPLKNEMKHPKKFSTAAGVLNVSMVPIILLYIIFALFGYLKYGPDTKGSITLNLPSNELLARSICALYSISIFINYHLCYYVVYDIVWKNFLKEKITKHRLFYEYLLRTVIPLITFVMAFAIPNLDLFISLVGAVGISTTSLAYPIVVNTLVFWDSFESKKKFYWFAIRNAVLFGIAIMIFLTGVIESVKDIYETYYSHTLS